MNNSDTDFIDSCRNMIYYATFMSFTYACQLLLRFAVDLSALSHLMMLVIVNFVVLCTVCAIALYHYFSDILFPLSSL